mmetsp:Transcript_19255/g.39013  ORF Transcript_19255/g.39013 Transcript_19255/m.39013 type:complete len:600 (+) Transcript_19255:1749-3548(+)
MFGRSIRRPLECRFFGLLCGGGGGGGNEAESIDAPHSLSAGTEDEEYTWEEEDDDEDDDDDDDSQAQVPLSAPQRMCQAIKNAFVVIANVENLWDSPPDPSHQGRSATTTTSGGSAGGGSDDDSVTTRRKKWIVLFWFVVLATSYAGERSTFKLLVDRAGPFRLFAVEMVTAVHAVLLGLSMAVYTIATKTQQNNHHRRHHHRTNSTSTSTFRSDTVTAGNTAQDATASLPDTTFRSNHPTAVAATSYSDKPLGLGIPLVDVSLMALLDVVNLILVFLTGMYVPPALTVILVQFILPLTVFLTQFSHPDGRCSCSGGGGTTTDDTAANAPLTTALPGWGGLSATHLWGSLIIFCAVVLALLPAFYSMSNPDFFVYADAIPLRTAYNSLLFVSACIPAAASQLYKEHVFLYYKQPVHLPLLNLVLSIFQFLFASVLSPLVFGLQGLGAKTDEDWTTLYPNTAFSQNFIDGLQCFFLQLDDDDQDNKYPEGARCDDALLLTILHAFFIIAVGVAVDRIVNAGATKVMYRGVSAGIILAVLVMQFYDLSIVQFSYGPFIDGLNWTCAILLILGSEVYHRVSLADATFETVYPPMENLYDTDD